MYYKDPNTNSVYFYDSEDQAKIGLVRITDEEALSLSSVDQTITADDNKNEAKFLLQTTDWVEFPSVNDPNITPQLLNVSDFLTYRSQIRLIAISPVAGNIAWPTKPSAQWKL